MGQFKKIGEKKLIDRPQHASPVWCTRDPGTSLSTGERAGQFSSVERTGKTLPRQLDEPYLLDLASATTVASTVVDLSTV